MAKRRVREQPRAYRVAKTAELFAWWLILLFIVVGIFGYFGLPSPNSGLWSPIPFVFRPVNTDHPVYSDIYQFFRVTVTSLIPVGIIYLAYQITLRYVRDAIEESRNYMLATVIEESIDSSIRESVPQVVSGVEESFRNAVSGIEEGVKYVVSGDKLAELGIAGGCMSLDEVKARAAEYEPVSIRIMTTWFTNQIPLHGIFREVSERRNSDISILLLDPDSESAKQRSRDLKEADAETVPTRIRQCCDDLMSLGIERMEIRYYDALPSFPLYIFDNHAFFGTFPHASFADSGPWLAVELTSHEEGRTHTGEFLEREFERMWEHDNTRRALG